MNTIKRLLVAFAALFIVTVPFVRSANANLIHVTTAINQNTNAGQSIISFATQVKLWPNPFNSPPSSWAKSVYEYTLFESTNTSRGIYFSIGSINVPFGTRGYQIEAAGNINGTFIDPIVAIYGYPGDTVTCYWFGPGTSQAIANGGNPYVQILNDNASGKSSGPQNPTANFAGSSLIDSVEAPYLNLSADSTWNTTFQSTKRNCWGDFPAANSGSNVSSNAFLAWYVTADFVSHFSTMVAPAYLDSAFVNYSGTSIPGCSIALSTFQYAGMTYTQVNTYGGQ